MFKALLINPPRDHLVHLEVPDFVDLGEISSFPPIGLMYLAQGVKATHPEMGIDILDCVADGLGYDQIAEYILKTRPQIIGITSFTYTL